jgi:hypothetical protein
MERTVNATIATLITFGLGITLLAQVGGIGSPPQRTNEGGGNSRGGENPGGVQPSNTLPLGVRETAPGIFRITDPRPLEAAMTLLSRKLGVPISYEEPAWESSADIIPAAEYPGNERMATRTFPRGPLIPRGGSFDVVILPNTAAPAAIQAAIQSHRDFRNPAEFKLITFGESEFAVVPERAGDKDGRLVPQTSPFDARITFPEEERTFSEAVEVVLQAVRTTRRVGIALPFDLKSLDGGAPKRRTGARNEVARDVLAKALHRPGDQKFSWNLRYDPQDKLYVFNLVGVRKEVQVPGGGVGLQYATWPR